MNNQIIQLEAYRLIRKKARDIVEPVDDVVLGSYIRGVVDLQTELYKLSETSGSKEEKMKMNNSDTVTNGSMFLKTYPDSQFSSIAYDDGICYVYVYLGGSRIRFTSDWWNASYKAEKEE